MHACLRVHVCVYARAFFCCRRWANEEEVSASLRECVVSEDPISPPPQAWLQGLRRTASTDEFVSVIKPRSVARAGTRQTQALGCSRAPAFSIQRTGPLCLPLHIDSQPSLAPRSAVYCYSDGACGIKTARVCACTRTSSRIHSVCLSTHLDDCPETWLLAAGKS